MTKVKLLVTITAVLGSALCLNCVEAHGQNAQIRGGAENGAPSTREDFVRLQKQRDEIIKPLLEVTQNQSGQEVAKERKRRAIELLGLYRAPEAVVTLAEQISIELPVRDYWRDDLLGKFAALNALIQIGNPSIRAAFDYVRTNNLVQDGGKLTDKQLHLFAYAIRQIDGQEIGLERIKDEIARTTDKQNNSLIAFQKVYLLNETETSLYLTLTPERERINAALKALKPLSEAEAEKAAWELKNAE